MARRERAYRPLTWWHFVGGFSALFTRNEYYRLWLGRDHLLLVSSSGYTEHYKRFYFQDIQAFIVRKTWLSRGITFVLSWAAVLILIMIVVGTVNSPESERFTFGAYLAAFLLGPLLVGLLINWVRGPSCACHVRTPVQIHGLPIRRLKTARRILEIVAPLIEAAQGQLTRERMQIGAWNDQRPIPASPSGPVQIRRGPPPIAAPARKNLRESFHSASFLLLMAYGVLNLFGAVINSMLVVVLDNLLAMAFLVTGIMAVRRQNGSNASRSLKRITIGVLAYGCSLYFVEIVILSAISFGVAQKGGNAFVDIWQAEAALSPADSLWVMWLRLISAAAALILSLAGLLVLIQKPRESGAPPPPPPPGSPPPLPSSPLEAKSEQEMPFPEMGEGQDADRNE